MIKFKPSKTKENTRKQNRSYDNVINNIKKDTSGLTMIEILISATVGALILIIVYSSFIAGQRMHRRGVLNSELSQNGRIALDRISREIRQTDQIATILIEEPPEPPQTEIMFEDGHTESIQYITYYTYNTDLMREQGHYYFSSNPDDWVDYDAEDNEGNPAIYITDTDQIVAQNISYINFYGERIISIDLTAEKKSKQIEFRTKNLGRNL